MRVVEDQRVGRGHHRGQVASRVAPVAFLLRPQHGFQVRLLASGRHFPLATARPLHRVGHEKELTDGIRKDNRALIPPFTDHVTARRNGPLQLDETLADNPPVGNRAGSRRHFGCTEQAGHVLAVEQDFVRRQFQAEIGDESAERVLIGGGDAGTENGQRHGPVHGAGVEVFDAQTLGKRSGRTALARAGGAVDGDDHGGDLNERAMRRSSRPPHPSPAEDDKVTR